MIPRWRTWSFLENFAKLICTVNLWSCQKSYFCPNLDNENILFITRMVVFSFSLVSQCWVHNSGDHAVFVWFSIVVVKHHTVTKSNPRKEKVYFYLVCPVHHPRSQAEVQGRNRGRGVGLGGGGSVGGLKLRPQRRSSKHAASCLLPGSHSPTFLYSPGPPA